MSTDRLPAAVSPRALATTANPYMQWWDYAQQIARALWAGIPLPAINVYGPVLEPGESAYLSSQAIYSRFAAGDGRYTTLDCLLLGPPAFTVSALALQGIVNHRRKIAAQRNAAPIWRNTSAAHVILTSDRLLTNSPSGWLSFWHETVQEFYINLHKWTMAIGFGGQCPPLRLTGACIPSLSVLTAHRIWGNQWSADPRLSLLLA